MHLDTVKVTKGQTVQAGQQIGTLGNTMFSDTKMKSPAHLHFEILNLYPPGHEPQGGGIQHRLNPQTFLEKQGAGGVSVKTSSKSTGGPGIGVFVVAAVGAWFLLRRKK
jgi:murein DD-endopeptidase MepM/ murein hydrolase activator NlpD